MGTHLHVASDGVQNARLGDWTLSEQPFARVTQFFESHPSSESSNIEIRESRIRRGAYQSQAG